MNIEILVSNVETQNLLQKTQEQAQALSASESQLLARRDELEENNARLSEQAQQLEMQAEELLSQKKALEISRETLTLIEERSRLILTSVNDGIIGLDTNGVTTFINRAGAEMLCFREEELIGKEIHPIIHFAFPDGSDFPNEKCSMKMTIHDGIPRTVTNEVLWRKDKTFVPVEYKTTPTYKNNRLVGIVVVFSDITERKRTEEELRKAKEMAEEATKMKSDFLANMSHEIRTPMNAIIGMTHLALQTELTSNQRNYMDKVDKAAKNLLGIINDILDFSKIEAGKLQFENTDFYLEDVLEHLSDLSVIKAQEKGLELLFNIATDVPTALTGDPLRLGQVMINLVNNAIKFTTKGEITVSIMLLEKDAQSATLRFEIKDTGIGMSKEQKEKLFTAFTQADTSTTRKYGGTGLGLTISKYMVEQMNGNVGVNTTPGAGSTFYFTAKFTLQSEQRIFDTSTAMSMQLRICLGSA